MLIDGEEFNDELIEALAEVDGYFEFIRPTNQSTEKECAALKEKGYAARNAKGSWYGTDKLKQLC